MSSPFDFDVFEKKEFDFLAELDRKQPDLNKSNSFFSDHKDGKNDFSLGDFPDPQPIDVDRRSHTTSDIFRVQKPDSNEQQNEANRSRHLDDISIGGAAGSSDSRFVYQSQPPINQPANDQSFELLNKLVRQPKPRDMNDFFKELSQDNKQNPNDSFLRREKYSNREEFEDYLRNLKLQKRRAEEQHQRSQQTKAKEDVFRKPPAQQQYYSPPLEEVKHLQPPAISRTKQASLEGSSNPRSGSYIPSGSNFEPKPSSNSGRPPLDFYSESSGTNKSHSQDLRQGQYLHRQQEKPKEDMFNQFDFGGLINDSFKLEGESPHVQRKDSYQFGQPQSPNDFFGQQQTNNNFFGQGSKGSEPAIGSLQLKSNVESKKHLETGEHQRNFGFEGERQTSIDSKKSESKVEPYRPPSTVVVQKPVSPPPTVSVQLPSKEIIKQPPQFEMLLEDDLINPDFDEAIIAQAPRFEPQPVLQQPKQPSSKSLPPIAKPAGKLTTIRQENSNIFEKTVEEEKLAKLLQNYEKMKNNFDALINEMKSNTEGQQKIMNELAALKHDYSDSKELNIQQLDRERKMRMEAIQDKELKVLELKKELQTIRSDERTLVEKQICERIASLEEVVRKSFEEMNSDKRQHMVWVNPEVSRGRESPPKQQPPSEEARDRFSQRASDENIFVQSRKTQQHNLAESHVEQIYSPLQLRLDNIQSPTAEDKQEESRRVAAFEFSRAVAARHYDGECYHPRAEHFDQNFKLACIHDQAVVYESFDFLVNCRYSMVKSGGRKVLKLAVSLRNKTVLTLNDLIVVVYGSVGEALSVSPARIYSQRLPPDDMLNFEAYLSNIVADSHHISMQLSYRSEALSKKKLQVRLPRPLTKFFDVQFTHEDQFKTIWKGLQRQLYIEARLLNFRTIRSSEDLKVMLPFLEVFQSITQVSQQDEHEFSLGLLFQLFNMEGMYLLKLLCSTDGRASLHLRYENQQQRHLGERVLDTINTLLFE